MCSTLSQTYFFYLSICLSVCLFIDLSLSPNLKRSCVFCFLVATQKLQTCSMAETVETTWRSVSSLSATGIGSVFIKILCLLLIFCFHFPFLSFSKDKLKTTDTELLLLYWLTTRKRNHSLWVPPTKLWADPNNQLNILENNLRKTNH